MVLPPRDRYDFLPRFYRLAGVSMASNIMVPLAGLVDVAFLGHLDSIEALAGVVLGTVLFDYLYRVLKFLRSSANALTAQAVGQGDEEGVLLAGLRSGLVALVLGVGIVLMQYPIQVLGFGLLSGSGAIEAAGVDYFQARIWGAPAVLLNFVLIGWLVGQERNGVVLGMSLVSNGSNVLLDWLMINRWGWGSGGAGLATAVSQYLGLLVAVVVVGLTVSLGSLRSALPRLLDWPSLRSAIALKRDLLVRFVVLISVYAIFTNLSAQQGTTTLAENGLLLQIALLSQFTVQGVGMTIQTLVGNFKGKGETEKLIPVLLVAIATSLVVALGFAGTTILWPGPVFGLLTNHGEISQGMMQSVVWLLPLLGLTAIAFMLEGYFIGLKEGAKLRNGVLLAFGLGFAPTAAIAWWLGSNVLLWLALTLYMAVLLLVLLLQLPRGEAIALTPSPNPESSP